MGSIFEEINKKAKDSFKNVVLDPQIEKLKEREWPEINYYPKILSNSLFVVGGFYI